MGIESNPPPTPLPSTPSVHAFPSVARCWHTGDCVCLSDPTLGRIASPASLLVLVGAQVASGIGQRQLQMPMIM
ncbi:hypothetical protein HZH66_012511 [Vespula vulgaris]|uniref:Uncharacterized protein n=1 Tax=Vespula vulgaris TaxID=7454 RepID=A0A834J956_VESVU|nr:hypothetical protein HZH66_012511 [Vespula vulgaris]